MSQPGNPTNGQWTTVSQPSTDVINQWINLNSMPQSIAPSTISPPLGQAQAEINNWAELQSKVFKMKTPDHYNIPIKQYLTSRLRGKLQPDGEIGLEIECEGKNLFNSPLKWWQVHHDNSLRAVGDHPPVEYVLRKPVTRKEVPEALKYLSDKLKLAGSSISDSVRTSVHVHLNCQSLSIKEIYQIVCLYIIFEEVLTDFSGPNRVGNLFCQRAKDAEFFISMLSNGVMNEDYRDLFSDNYRYSGCNVSSIGKFGSLEFRTMRGTVDRKLIQQWVDILLLIRDEALKYESPRAIVDDFHSSRPIAFFEKIFGNRQDLAILFRYHPNLHKSMWDGLRLMRDVACCVKWKKKEEKSVPTKKNEEQYSLEEQPFLDQNIHSPFYPELVTIDHNGILKTVWFNNNGSCFIESANSTVSTVNTTWAVGSYWVVNITNLQQPLLTKAGIIQNLVLYPRHKALISANHQYQGQVALAPNENF